MQPADLEKNDIKLSMLLERYRPATMTEMSKALNEALDNITAALARTEDVSQKKRLRTLKKIIEEELSAAYAKMPGLLAKDMAEVADTTYTYSAAALATHGATAGAFSELPKRAISKILDMDEVIRFGDKGYSINDFVSEQTDYQVRRFKQIVAAGLAEGASIKKIADRLKEANNKAKKSDIDSIARTVVAEARGRAAAEAFAQADDVVIGWKSVGVLDSRTTFLCASLDGKTWLKKDGWTVEKLISNNYWYPRHFRCRTVVRPVTKLSEEFDKSRTRAYNMGGKGQISGKTDFQHEFDRQGAEFQKDYLGPGRYELYESGKLKIKDFVDVKSGREYTISEIKDRMQL